MYKGRMTYGDILDMPIGDFVTFRYLIYKKSLTEEGRKEMAAEHMGDAVEEIL